MKLEDTRALYPGEWIAFRALEAGDNPEGEVVLHNKERSVPLVRDLREERSC